MKNRLAIAVLALVVALTIAVPALAAGHRATPTPDKGFSTVGVVINVVRTAGALRMHVDLGSQAVRPFIGGNLALRVGKDATIRAITDGGNAHLIRLAEVKAGDQVRITGWVDRTTPRSPIFVARVINVIRRTPPEKLTSFGCGGPVTAVDATGTPGTLTLTVMNASRALWDQLGKPLKVVCTPQTELLLDTGTTTTPITLAQIVVGQHARVVGSIDRSQATPVFTADKVTVQPLPTPTP